MFPGVKLCDIQHTFLLEVEKDFLQRDLSACDRNGDGCAKWGCWWHLCTTFVLFMTFIHPLPAQVVPNTYCGRRVLNCYLMESASENHKPEMSKAATRPRVMNTLLLRVCLCGKANTVGILLSSPFWVLRLPFKLFINFALKLPAVASFSLMLCPAVGALRGCLSLQHPLPGLCVYTSSTGWGRWSSQA